MSNLKPIIIYAHIGGPNTWKVVMTAEELGIPYELSPVPFDQMKGPVFTAINPNGRAPALVDPNQEVTVFESGACVEYLVQEYDKTHKISFTDLKEKYQALSWLHFQMSGQGPYFGQLAWFTNYHPGEKIIGAIDRYANETKRVLGVIESQLSGGVKKTGEVDYLVGNKFSFVDLCFVPWNNNIGTYLLAKGAPGNVTLDWQKEFPKSYAWHQRLLQQPSVAKALKVQQEALAA